MVRHNHDVTFTKRRIIQLWQKESRSLQYLLPLAKNQIDFLTLGFQMVGRMKPILEHGYKEDHPDQQPNMLNVIHWMQANGWNDMAQEFSEFLQQVDCCMKEAHQG